MTLSVTNPKPFPIPEVSTLDHFQSSLLALATQNQFNRRSVFDVLADAGITSVSVEADLSGRVLIANVSARSGGLIATLPAAMVRVMAVRCLQQDSYSGQVTLPQAIEGMPRDFLDLIPGELPGPQATFELDVAERRLSLCAAMPAARLRQRVSDGVPTPRSRPWPQRRESLPASPGLQIAAPSSRRDRAPRSPATAANSRYRGQPCT